MNKSLYDLQIPPMTKQMANEYALRASRRRWKNAKESGAHNGQMESVGEVGIILVTLCTYPHPHGSPVPLIISLVVRH